MKALVFGSTGLIGRQLVKNLLEKGHSVTGTSRSEIQNLFSSSQYTHLALDITNKNEFINLKGGYDWVFNTTGYVPKYQKDSELAMCLQNNVIGVQNILDYMMSHKMKRFIHSSSVTVYGMPQKLYVHEESKLEPVIVYGISKLTAETLCTMYAKLYGFEITMLRYSPVYGPGLTQKTALPLFIEKALKNENITIFQNGKRSQDYVYVEDAVQANLLAAEKNISGIFNIASGEVSSMKDLAQIIISVLGSKSKIFFDKTKPEEFSIGIDIKKAVQELGYVPQYNLRKGLEEYKKFLI